MSEHRYNCETTGRRSHKRVDDDRRIVRTFLPTEDSGSFDFFAVRANKLA